MVRTASRTAKRRRISSRTAARLHGAKGRPSSSGVWCRMRSRASLSWSESRNRPYPGSRSEEHTSELQSRQYLVCRLLLEKKKRQYIRSYVHTSDIQSRHYLYFIFLL